MTKQKVLERIKEIVEYIDKYCETQKTITKKGKKKQYLRGVASLEEKVLTEEVMKIWIEKYLEDFDDKTKIHIEYKYPEDGSIKCDLVFSSKGYKGKFENEWAIEIKKVLTIGDNGKDFDFTTKRIHAKGKKKSSMYNDSKRLTKSLIAENKLVIGYGFKYDKDKFVYMRTLHSKYKERLINLEKELKKNDWDLNLNEDMVSLKNDLMARGWIKEDFELIDFWAPKHPCGGYGEMYVFQIN
jgi:hypothetical protein